MEETYTQLDVSTINLLLTNITGNWKGNVISELWVSVFSDLVIWRKSVFTGFICDCRASLLPHYILYILYILPHYRLTCMCLCMHTVLHQRKTHIPENNVISLLDWSHVQQPPQSCSYNISHQSGRGTPIAQPVWELSWVSHSSLQGRVLHSTPPAQPQREQEMSSLQASCSSAAGSTGCHTFPPYPKVPLPLTALSVSAFPGATKGHQHVPHQLSLFGNKYWLKGPLLHLNDLQQVTSLQTQTIRNKKAWQSAVANKKILTDGASILSFSLQEHSLPLRFFPHLVVQ